MSTFLMIAVAIVLASDMIMGAIMFCHYQRIDDRLFNMSERISEIKRPRRGTYQDFIRTQRKDEIVFTEYDKPEEVIELMTQGGYTIRDVYVETMYGPNEKIWTPLNYISGCPAEGRVLFAGTRNTIEYSFKTAICYDFKWLKEWWKGSWQANI